VTGANLARWVRSGRSIRQGVFDGAKREGVRCGRMLGCGRRVRGRGSGGHPKGRKRRSGWDSRTDVKGWTRELAFDEWGWLWSALVERELTFVRALVSWLHWLLELALRAEWGGVKPCGWCARMH
jgi:hypothetical protein